MQVKTYSAYAKLAQAPFGFQMPCKPTDAKAWYHIPTGNIKFAIFEAESGCLIIKVEKDGIIMEIASVDIFGSDKYIQFSARSPSISCKYIVRQGINLFIKRFQIAFHDEKDFAKTCSTLSYLRFVVKNARPSIPLNNAVHNSQLPSDMREKLPYKSNQFSQTTQIYQTPSILPCEDERKDLNDALNPISSQQALLYDSFSQNSEQYQTIQGIVGTTEAGHTNVTLSAKQSISRCLEPAGTDNGTDLGVTLVDEPSDKEIPGLKSKMEAALSTRQSEDHYEPTEVPDEPENTRFLPAYTTKGLGKSIESALPTASANPTLPVSEPNATRQPIVPAQCEKKEIRPGERLHKESMEKPIEQSLGKTNPIMARTEVKKGLPKVSITKRIIAQKMKDENFMKWVKKVESSMLEMSKTEKEKYNTKS